MKNVILVLSFLFSGAIYCQTQTATTIDGKKVLLKPDKTWEFINTNSEVKECDLEKDAIKGNERLRKHVAVENDCKPEDVKFINQTERLGNGMYSVCVKGKIMKYKKAGTVFMRADANPFGGQY